MAEKKKDYYKNLKDLGEFHWEGSYQDTDVFEKSDHQYTGPVRKKSESAVDFKDYDKGPRDVLDFKTKRDCIADALEFHKVPNCNVKFFTDVTPEDDKDFFELTCNDYVYVDDKTEKEYQRKCADVVKLIRKYCKDTTGKTLTCKITDENFETQMYGHRYGDLPVPGADVQMNVANKNRSYVTYRCVCEYK
tara:strand:- start:1374 stop:1946 length:573 start_codon:yes stop_codon:yes gene_type:complete